jgi:hypothetical protein
MASPFIVFQSFLFVVALSQTGLAGAEIQSSDLASDSFTSCGSTAPLLLGSVEELYSVFDSTNSSVYLLVFLNEEVSDGKEHIVFDTVAAMFAGSMFVKFADPGQTRFLSEFLIFGLPSIVQITDSSFNTSFSGDPANLSEMQKWIERNENMTAARIVVSSVPRSPIPLSRSKRFVLPFWLPLLCAIFSGIYASYAISSEFLNAFRWLRS